MRYIINESTYNKIIKKLITENKDEFLEDLSYFLKKCIDLKNEIIMDDSLPEIEGQDEDTKNEFVSGVATSSEYGETALDILFELMTGEVRDKRRKQKGVKESFDLIHYFISNNITDPFEIIGYIP